MKSLLLLLISPVIFGFEDVLDGVNELEIAKLDIDKIKMHRISFNASIADICDKMMCECGCFACFYILFEISTLKFDFFHCVRKLWDFHCT